MQSEKNKKEMNHYGMNRYTRTELAYAVKYLINFNLRIFAFFCLITGGPVQYGVNRFTSYDHHKTHNLFIFVFSLPYLYKNMNRLKEDTQTNRTHLRKSWKLFYGYNYVMNRFMS